MRLRNRRLVAALAPMLVFSGLLSTTAPREASSQSAPPPSLVAKELARLAAGSEVKGFHVGVEVVEIETGRVLAAAGEHQPLNPASNEKIVTAITVLSMLHPEFRVETGLFGPSTKGSVLSGSLVLRGYGDPSLRVGDLYAMALELKRDGVKRIDGGIIVDQRFFDDQYTPPAFDQQPGEWMPFRANVSALSLDENVLVATIRPSGGGVATVTIWPPGLVDVEGTVKLDEGKPTVQLALAKAEGNPQRMKAIVSGTIPGDVRGVTYYRRVEDPSLLGGYALKAVLTDLGIEVKGDVKVGSGGGTLLAKHKSAPLAALLLPVGKDSDNFYAETLLKVLGGEKKGKPATSAKGAEIVTEFLGKIGALDAGVTISNGSGLFDGNRATAHELATALRWAYREPSLHAEMLTQMSIGGIDGTLRGRFKSEHERRAIRAKTGTLDDAVALSGYVLAPPGKSAVAFSVLVNGCKGRVGVARGFADKIVEKIVKELWAGT